MLEQDFAAWAQRKRAGTDKHDTFPQADRLLLLRRTYGWGGGSTGQFQTFSPAVPIAAVRS